MRPETRSTRNTRPLTEESALHSVPATALKRPRPFEIYRDDVSAPIRKKSRHRMTDLQLERLEALYQYATHPTRQEKESLGKEVGMDERTVTVWFQNRRQLAKKASDAEVVAKRHGTQTPPTRQPLAVMPTAANQQVLERPAAIVSDSSSTVILHPKPTYAQPTANRSRLFSSFPQIRPEHRPAKQMGSQQEIQPKIHTFERASRQQSLSDSTGSDGDTTDEDVDILSTDDDEIVHPQSAIRTGIKDVEIPAELSARFPEDIVFGASLLLSFQHSAI